MSSSKAKIYVSSNIFNSWGVSNFRELVDFISSFMANFVFSIFIHDLFSILFFIYGKFYYLIFLLKFRFRLDSDK